MLNSNTNYAKSFGQHVLLISLRDTTLKISPLNKLLYIFCLQKSRVVKSQLKYIKDPTGFFVAVF